jgi:hypothetical protein
MCANRCDTKVQVKKIDICGEMRREKRLGNREYENNNKEGESMRTKRMKSAR